MDWSDVGLVDSILDNLKEIARENGAIFVKIDPEIVALRGEGLPQRTGLMDPAQSVLDQLEMRGYRISPQQVQFKNTAVLDLTCPEPELLAAMKQKTTLQYPPGRQKRCKDSAGIDRGSGASLPNVSGDISP